LGTKTVRGGTQQPTGLSFDAAQATNTRALALVGDADANAYELLFSFCIFSRQRAVFAFGPQQRGHVNDYIVEKEGGP